MCVQKAKGSGCWSLGFERWLGNSSIHDTPTLFLKRIKNNHSGEWQEDPVCI